MTDVANEATKNTNIAKLLAKIPTMAVATIIKPPQIVKIWTSNMPGFVGKLNLT